MPTTTEAIRLERELRRAFAAIVDQQTRDLVQAWAVAWDEVAPELRDTLVELLDGSEDPRVTATTLRRSRRLAKALAVIGDQIEQLSAEAGVRITADLQRIVDQAGQAQARIIASMLPDDQDLVDLETWSRISDRQITAIVRRTTQQITALRQPLSRQATQAVRRELIRGISVGSNPKATASRIVRRAEQRFNGGLTRALVISRTESIDAHRAAAELGLAEHADVLAGWVWLAALTPRTCPSCLAKHGTEHPLDEPGPLDHQQGRCSRMPKTKSWRELGFDADEPADATPDADAFFEGLSAGEQEAILGPEGYRAWQAGIFPREQWSVRRETAGWRDSYVPAKPPNIGTTPVPGPAVGALPPGLPASQFTQAQLLNVQASLANADTHVAYEHADYNDPAVAELARIEIRRRQALPASTAFEKALPTLRRRDSIANSLKVVNPNYTAGVNDEWSNNCTHCTSAMELRRRAYDVTAKPLPQGRGLSEVASHWLADPESMEQLGWVQAQNRILGYGDGARGALVVFWKPTRYSRGGGHIFNWEVINGQIVWSDAQPGYADSTDFISQYRSRWTGRLHVFRLDHLPIRDELADYVEQVGAP